MTKFSFRLLTLLKLREAARDQRRAQLAQAYEAERILQQQNHELSDELDQIKGQMRSATRPGQVDVDSLLVSHRYELLLQSHQQQLKNQGKQITEEIERRRSLLAEADMQVRVLEKLRDRQLKIHNDKEQKRELAEMDEFAARRTDKR